jgi:hypothetical protein
MRISYFLFLVLAIGLVSKPAQAQSTIQNPTVEITERIPQSPNAASLSRYLEYPVNGSTGAPSIQIPLYVIKTGNISLPITLSYNAGGVKVNQHSTWVGAGWTLPIVGSINKQVNGFDDFDALSIGNTAQQTAPNFNYVSTDYTYFDNTLPFTNITDFVDSTRSSYYPISNGEKIKSFLGRIVQGKFDAEADQYLFSTLHGSGAFYYNQKIANFQFDKPEGWTVFMDVDTLFSIGTKEGIRYLFGLKERTVNPLWYASNSLKKYLTNTWLPTSIEDIVSGKSVTLSYDNNYSYTMTSRRMREDYIQQPSSSNYSAFGSEVSDIYREGDEYSISTITFDEGRVVFVKDTARLDEGTKPLKEIRIYNNRNVLLKKFVLEYFYTTSPTGVYCNEPVKRLFLSSVNEINYGLKGDSTIGRPYQFAYNSTVLPCIYSLAQDLWGYYNGKTSNTTLVPTYSWYSSLSIPAQGDRSIDTTLTQAGILKEITYPTGGIAKFEYENHDIGVKVGGLRVRRITNIDSVANKSLVREYEYKWANGNPSGYLLYNPLTYYNYTYTSGPTDLNVFRLLGEAINPLFPNQGSPVFYNTVLEKQIGPDSELRIRHHYGPGVNSTYDPDADNTYQNMCCGVPYNKYPARLEHRSFESMTETFIKDGSGQYVVQSRDSINYSAITSGSKYVWNVQAAWAMVMDGWITWPGNDPYSTNPMNLNASMNAYKFVQQKAVPTSRHSRVNTETGTSLTAVYSEYDTVNSNLKRNTYVDSKGDTTVVITKYAFEYLNTGASSGVNYEIRLLHDANMQAAPIETVTLFKRKDSASFVVQKAELYEYAGYVPSKIYTINGAFPYSGFTWSYNNSGGFYKDNRYQLETEVLSFDSEKRPKSVASRNGIVTSYVWDTLCQIPSAVVRNAAVSDIAYAGFETPGNASWSFASAARDSSSALTGRKSYILTNGNISKSGLSASLTYQVTYWHKNSSGSVSINGQTATSLGTANGWTLYSKELSSITSVTVSGTGRIDELRLHPKGAQMTSFASEALLGLTSECDQNNSLRYYEYDGLGRLTIVRDKDRNVLKKVCYNYQGQVQNCSGVYENEAKTQLFVRNNCSSGYVGTGVYYTVPAGKYTAASQAAANQLALDEISASGQSYANTNGNCVSVGCNFSVNSGFSSPTSSFSNSGTSVSFYFVFYSTSTMSSGIEYNVGTIGVSCRPSIARQMYFTSGGRSWTVTVYPDGRMTVLIASGTSVSPYSSVATPTLTYSL